MEFVLLTPGGAFIQENEFKLGQGYEDDQGNVELVLREEIKELGLVSLAEKKGCDCSLTIAEK